MEMLQLAVQQNADIDKLAKLMDLEERWRAAKAKEAFVRAMTAFKAEPTRVLRTKVASVRSDKGAYSYQYAPLIQVVDAVCAGLSKHGLSHRWETSQEGNKITVTCILTHELGYSERTPLSAEPDNSGGKNSIQAIGSTVTYLQRYTLLAATGMASADQDDDGKMATVKKQDDDPALVPWRKKFADAGAMSALQAVWKEVPKDLRYRLQDDFAEAKARVEAAERVAAGG
ncbi:MAG: ERF family protein [Thermoanaerobaculia bacterium]